MKTRIFNLLEDYKLLESWWDAHGSYPPKPEHLSETGIIVEDNEQPICAGFLYQTDSKICVFEFVVSNPKAAKDKRNDALKRLIEVIQNLAEKLDYSLVYTSINVKHYINKLLNAGFMVMDKGQTHLFYEVTNNE